MSKQSISISQAPREISTSRARPDISVTKYNDPHALFDDFGGGMVEAFHNVRPNLQKPDPDYRGNSGVVRLYDTSNGAFGKPYSNMSEPLGLKTSWGHSERAGMRDLLDDTIISNKHEWYIKPPSEDYRDRYNKGIEIAQNLKLNAGLYRNYLQEAYPNSIVQMLSERPACGYSESKGGSCDSFNGSIFPKGSTYGHIAGSDSDVRPAYERLHGAYSARAQMRPQPFTYPWSATPSFVPRGDLSTLAGSGYNPESSLSTTSPSISSSSSSSSLSYNPSISSPATVGGMNPSSFQTAPSRSSSSSLPYSSSSSSSSSSRGSYYNQSDPNDPIQYMDSPTMSSRSPWLSIEIPKISLGNSPSLDPTSQSGKDTPPTPISRLSHGLPPSPIQSPMYRPPNASNTDPYRSRSYSPERKMPLYQPQPPNGQEMIQPNRRPMLTQALQPALAAQNLPLTAQQQQRMQANRQAAIERQRRGR